MDGLFLQKHREESDIKIQEHMLDYVIDLLDDATDFSWASTKGSHAVFLCRMEQGEIGSWLETEKLTGYMGPNLKDTILVKVVLRELKINIPWQRLLLVFIIIKVCAHKNKHMKPALCWAKDGKAYPHPQTECRRSTKSQ